MIDYRKKQAQIVVATKELVDWLLSLNTHNRTVRQSEVDRMRKNLRAGRWVLTGQGVAVAASGFLIDGQHRLMALAAEGYPPVEFLLVTGLGDAAQAATDTGAKRTQSDVIKLLLNQNVSSRLIAAVNVALRVINEDGYFVHLGGRERTSEHEIARFIEDHQEVLTPIVAEAGTLRAGVVAAFIDYARWYDLPAACELLEQVRTGMNLEKDSPAYRLVRWLATNKSAGAQGQYDAYRTTASACMAHARGDRPLRLSTPDSWDRLPRRVKRAA